MIKKLLAAIFLLNVSAAVGAAQINPEQSVLNAREQFSDIKKRSMELERIKRDANRKSVSENFTLNFRAIKEDFEQIQKLNSSILELNVVQMPENLPALSKFVSEIKRRAARLRSNLFSSETDENAEPANEPQNVSEKQDVAMLLVALDKSLDSFVRSPVFQNINLVNSDESLKAQQDLENIIKISAAIKAKAKKPSRGDSRK